MLDLSMCLVASQSELSDLVLNAFSHEKSHIEQARLGPYWENIKPASFL